MAEHGTLNHVRTRKAWMGRGAAALGLRGLIRPHDERLASYLVKDHPIVVTLHTPFPEGLDERADLNELRRSHRRATDAVVTYIEATLTGTTVIATATTSERTDSISTALQISREAFSAPDVAIAIDGEAIERQRDTLAALHRSHTYALLAEHAEPTEHTSHPLTNDGVTAAFFEMLAGPRGVTELRPTFNRESCLAALLERSPVWLRVDQAVALRDRFLDAEAICVTGSPTLPDARFTTNDMLATELRVVIGAVEGVDSGRCVVDDMTREAVLQHWERREPAKALTRERRQALDMITGSGNAVDLLIGAAGAGKTKLMAAARDIWGAAGIQTIGSAPTATAMQRLEEKTGIRTVALERLGDQGNAAIPYGCVVILDEAGAIATRDLDRIMANAQARNAKLVLVGDPHQMAPTAAGGALIALADRLPVVATISSTRRQDRAWERSALLELRTGDIPAAVEAYRQHKRLLGAQHHEAALELAAAAWINASEGLGRRTTALEQSAVMIAYGEPRVRALTTLARQELRALGALSGPDLFAGNEREGFAAGDQVILGFTASYLDVNEGSFGVIDAVSDDAVLVTINIAGKAQSRVIPAGHFTRGEVRHAYAFDVREIQSRKVAHTVYVMGVHANREEAYAALSRGVRRNDIVLELPTERSAMTDVEMAHAFAVRLQRSGAPRTALDALHAAVYPTSLEQAAIERITSRRAALHARIDECLAALDAPGLATAEQATLTTQLAQARRALSSAQKRLADLQRAQDSTTALVTLGGVHTVHRSFTEFTEIDPTLSQRYGDLAEQYAAASLRLTDEEVLGDHVIIDTGDGVAFEADFLVRGPKGVYIKEVKAGRGSLTKAQKRGHPAVAAHGGVILSGNFGPKSTMRPGTSLPPTPVVREIWR